METGVGGGKLWIHGGERSNRGAEGKSERFPQRIRADQHSPASEACLLTSWDGWGLGAEAPALEVRSQGEDWGWLREHSLKGASVPQLVRRSPGKIMDLPKRQENIISGCARRGDSEHHLNEFQRWSRATAISADTRDGHEMLRLLLHPPKILCASTGHSPHHPSREPVQPATVRVP